MSHIATEGTKFAKGVVYETRPRYPAKRLSGGHKKARAGIVPSAGLGCSGLRRVSCVLDIAHGY